MAPLMMAILMQTSAVPSAAGIEPASETSTQFPAAAIFQFGRANFFHALVNARNCTQQHPEETRVLNERFEQDRKRLEAKFGKEYFDLAPIDPNTLDVQRSCDSGTLRGFEDKLVGVEQLLNGDR